jgi:hypothetical protein
LGFALKGAVKLVTVEAHRAHTKPFGQEVLGTLAESWTFPSQLQSQELFGAEKLWALALPMSG